MDRLIKYNCIFGGGGVRGMCYVGVLRALKELNIEIDNIAGSSVGAVFAGLLAAGYDEKEIQEMFFNFNFNMFRDININIFNTDISLSKGEIFLDWLREKIGKKVLGDKYRENSKVKFKDLDKNLHILTLDINTNTPYIFSKENTPDEEVAFAIRTSACMPGLMKPISLGESILVDGDLIKSWAGCKIYNDLDTSNNRILEFRLEGKKDSTDFKNPVDYINSVISTIWYLCTENVYNLNHENDRYDYIILDTKDVVFFDFNIDRNKKEKLAEKGYQITKNYFQNVIIDKKKNILNVYKKILKNLNYLRNAINKNKPLDAVFTINEILSSMFEDLKYIDSSIYFKIKDFKESIITNTKKQFIFSSKMDNEKQIKERCEFIYMLVEERILEIEKYINLHCNKS